jgi:hypothetical protein
VKNFLKVCMVVFLTTAAMSFSMAGPPPQNNVSVGRATPTGSCSGSNPVFVDESGGILYICHNGSWLAVGTFNPAAPGAIGGTTPGAGAFTTLSASSTVSGTGFSAYLASPPPIGGTVAAAGKFTTTSTATNCSSSASPAVCGAAAAGAVALPTGTAPTLVVDTSAVTANSEILLTVDEGLTISGVTCNSTLATLLNPVVTARVPGVSFTFTINATIAVNPACVSFRVIN